MLTSNFVRGTIQTMESKMPRYCVDVCFDLDDEDLSDTMAARKREQIENALEDALNKLPFVTNVETLDFYLL